MRKLYRLLPFVLPLVLLTGCATEIMQGYVGRPVEAAMARYGRPDDTFDLPDGRRAFQWIEVETSTSPGYAVTRTRRERGDDGGHRPSRTTRTEYTPPSETANRCVYTLYGRRDPQTSGWVVDGFAPPALGC